MPSRPTPALPARRTPFRRAALSLVLLGATSGVALPAVAPVAAPLGAQIAAPLAPLVKPLVPGGGTVPAGTTPAGDGVARVPFAVGERLQYDVRFGPIKVGSGSMHVEGVETVRGRPAWHTVFRVRGGTAFFKVDDTFESWFARDDLAALRFHKDQQEGTKERRARYEIFPERRTWDDLADRLGEQPSVERPLDDGSFLYFVRTVPLTVGETYTFNDYFRPDRNPVTLRVLRRERVTVPAGTFDAVVVQPVIKTKGIFSEGGQAQVWLSDDDRRMVLQLKSKLSFGSLNLYLTRATPGGR